MKRKEMNKGTCTAKNKSYWEIWDSKLEKMHCRTSIGRRHRSYKQEKKAKHRCKSVDKDVIKFKSIRYKNRWDRKRV